MAPRTEKAAAGDKINAESVAVNPDDILTPEELAKRLKLPVTWVREKTRSRCPDPMPCFRIGRYVRFDWKRVAEWLRSTEGRAS